MPPETNVRVGYVVKVYPRFSETFIVNEILAHEAAGLDIRIYSLRPPGDPRYHDSLARVRAPVHYVPSSGLRADDLWSELTGGAAELPDLWRALEHAAGADGRDAFQAVALARQAQADGVTHLHAHFATSAATVARMAARLMHVPYSLTAHAKDIFHTSVDLDDLRRKLRDAVATLTVSDFNVDHLRGLAPAAADRVHCVRNGLDLSSFPYEAPDGRSPVVAAVGRLVEKKGFGELVDACAVLAQRGCRFRCEIAGSGELEDELRARIERLGVSDRVRLLGPRTQDEIRALMRRAAVVAAPCVVAADGNRDGLPTVLLEAMALGTPCVSTPVTGIPELVRDGETGLIAPERDPEALATAIERLLEDVPLRVRLAENARDLVARDYDASRNTAAMRSLLWDPPHAPAVEEVPRADRVHVR